MKGWGNVSMLVVLTLLLLLFRTQLSGFIEAVTNNMILETGGRF